MVFGVANNASGRLFFVDRQLFLAGSRGYPVKLVELPRRARLRATFFGPGSEDRLLKAMGEYEGHSMSMLEFLYTTRGICMPGVGLWLVLPVELELDKIKIPDDPSKVEIENKNSLVSLIF